MDLISHPTIYLLLGKKQVFQVALEPLGFHDNQPALGVGSPVAQLGLSQNLVVDGYDRSGYWGEHLRLITLPRKTETYLALLNLLSQGGKPVFIHWAHQLQGKIIQAQSYPPAILYPGPAMTAMVVVVVRHLIT
jgi:hypothetical protein